MDKEVEKMSEQEFARMEDMFSQLIGMVAKTNEKMDNFSKEIQTMNGEISSIKGEIGSIKKDQHTMSNDVCSFKKGQQSMRVENERRHDVFMRKFNNIEADQDYTFNKVVRNEREIVKIKEEQFSS